MKTSTIYLRIVLGAFLLTLDLGCQRERISERADVASPRERDYSWMSVDSWWQRHRALVALGRTFKKESKIAFLGDSIVEFWDERVLRENYGQFKPLKLGLGGDKTQEVLFRIKDGELDGLEPKVVVLLVGTNNFGLADETPESVAAGVRAVVEAVKAKLPNALILLLGLLPRDQLPRTTFRQKILQTNAQLASLHDPRVKYRDLSSVFLDESGKIPVELMADFLHPTAKGYEVMLKALAPTLDEMLNDTDNRVSSQNER